jgi:hypothetical protein
VGLFHDGQGPGPAAQFTGHGDIGQPAGCWSRPPGITARVPQPRPGDAAPLGIGPTGGPGPAGTKAMPVAGLVIEPCDLDCPEELLGGHQPENSADAVAAEPVPVADLDHSLAEAVATARAVAGGKNLEILGADLASQCLQRGLVDEVLVYVLPILLGDGVRFSTSGLGRIDLEPFSNRQSGPVTMLRFRVRKKARSQLRAFDPRACCGPRWS